MYKPTAASSTATLEPVPASSRKNDSPAPSDAGEQVRGLLVITDGTSATTPHSQGCTSTSIMLTSGWITCIDVSGLEAAVKSAPTDVARMLAMRDSAKFHGGPQFASSSALATASSATNRMRAIILQMS